MHEKNPTRTGDRMVYSFLLVALVSRRRSRSGRVKGMPIVGVLGREWETAGLVDGDRMWGIRGVVGLQSFRVAPITVADISYTHFLGKSA